MKRVKKAGFALVLTGVALGLSCMATQVPLQVMKPATIELPSIHRIAIAEFSGIDHSGSFATNVLYDQLAQRQYFELVERGKIEDVIREQRLSLSGLVSEETAKEVGNLLGVDALIYGDVAAYAIEDETGTDKVKERVWTGEYEKDEKGNFIYEKNLFGKKEKKKKYKEVLTDRDYTIRHGNVTVTFRLVDVESGRVLSARTHSQSYKSNKISEGSSRSLPPQDEVLTNLMRDVVVIFVDEVTPHTITVKRVIEDGPDEIKNGKELAKSGLWQEALEVWQTAVQKYPTNSAAFYNLALAYEVMGNLNVAEENYRQALKIKQSKLYMEALANIRQAQEEAEILQRQLRQKEKDEEEK